ncbi:hypothetical protein PAERUG_P48_London_17_VIM_2_01_13_02942 [Pseudomonas aeruginosa]|nr:hypothetical protein PAERUG_P48_London_17_VIM_2_01_13_02942 [Pseudomonas aeruginosa]
MATTESIGRADTNPSTSAPWDTRLLLPRLMNSTPAAVTSSSASSSSRLALPAGTTWPADARLFCNQSSSPGCWVSATKFWFMRAS